MFNKGPVRLVWIILFLAVPAAIVGWELAHNTYNNPGRHIEHLLLLVLFMRGLFELYGLPEDQEASEK